MKKICVIVAGIGEYEDRLETPVAAVDDRTEADRIVELAGGIRCDYERCRPEFPADGEEGAWDAADAKMEKHHKKHITRLAAALGVSKAALAYFADDHFIFPDFRVYEVEISQVAERERGAK